MSRNPMLIVVIAGMTACSSQHSQSQTLATSRQYDGGSRQLVVGCTSSSTGACHFRLDDAGLQRSFTVKAGQTAAFARVAPTALLCAQASDDALAGCEGTPLQQANASGAG